MRVGLFAFAAGCAIGAPGFAHAGSAGAVDREASALARKIDKQVAAAERTALKNAGSAELRSKLAQAYLSAGRFPSAAASFEDAVALGDKSPATALGMALSYIGSGRNAEGTALLEQWRDSMPAGDYALALALAGQPGRAAAILSDVIKGGENTPKLRQNLAYAFALSGKLGEARVVAAQDVPAEHLDARISAWALQAGMGSQQSRVAALLGAPLRDDPGRPMALALASEPSAPKLAAAALPRADEELPPLASSPAAVAQVEPIVEEPPVLASAPDRFVSEPLVQAAAVSRHIAGSEPPARSIAAPKPANRPKPQAKPKVASAVAQNAGSHVVQLGSFTTEEGARRAWGIFVRRDPSLKNRELRITEAMVHGRKYFRVAAAGYDAGTAKDKCSAIRGQGRQCLAYAKTDAKSGSLPIRAIAQRLARR